MTDTAHSKLIYNKFGQPVTDLRSNKIYIFGSSSKGNSVYFKEPRILIDLGFSYKTYSKYDPNFFLKTDYIFLTHEHDDHLKPTTLIKVLETSPNTKIIIPQRMANVIIQEEWCKKKKIKQSKLYEYSDRFLVALPMNLPSQFVGNIAFMPHITSHGPITNVAIELVYNNQHVLYASDLDDFDPNTERMTDGLPQQLNNPFDIICLEANYNRQILDKRIKEDVEHVERLREAIAIAIHGDIDTLNQLNDEFKKANNRLYRSTGNLRHIDEEMAWQYVQTYLKNDGIFIPLHASAEYGTMHQFRNT